MMPPAAPSATAAAAAGRSITDFRAAACAIDDGPPRGAVCWPVLLRIAATVAELQLLPADLLAALNERLKSEAAPVVLNTLTALHTICINSAGPVHDQLAPSKPLKQLERLLVKPPFPGVEVAAAQLLMDLAFLFGGSQLGARALAALTATRQHRAMLQDMAASDVAVLLMEDQRLGLPRFGGLVQGLDFQAHFATQFAAPLTGGAAAPSSGGSGGVLAQLAKAAVAASYSGSSSAAAAAAAASRNTFAAWAERVQQDPGAAAQRVLDARQQLEADLAALQAAQAACLATAKPLRHQQQQQQQGPDDTSSSSSVLRHELDKAYLAACKAAEWREMVEVLVQHPLPQPTQLSALLQLSDTVNAALDAWQAAATTELYWLLGVDTARLADGSLLPSVVAAATGGPAAAASGDAAAAAAASQGTSSSSTSKGAPPKQQQQQEAVGGQRTGGLLTRGSGSYLDLLTGDALPPLSATNPFLLSATASGAAPPPSSLQQQQQRAGGPGGAPPPQLQSYLQELGVAAAAPAAVQQPQQQQQQQQPGPTKVASMARAGSTTSTSTSAAAPPPQQQQHLPTGDRQQHRQDTGGGGSRVLRSHSVNLAAAGDSGSSSDSAPGGGGGGGTRGPATVGGSSSSYINPFASLDTSVLLQGMRAQQQQAGSSGGGGGAPGSLLQRRSTDQQGGGPPPAARASSSSSTSAAAAATTTGGSSSTATVGSSGGGGAAAAGVAQHLAGLSLGPEHQQALERQVAQLLAPTAAAGGCACAGCGLPARPALHAGVLGLLAQQQQQHAWQLARLQQQHQREVAELKATAVQRFKELMARAQQQQQ